jgi:hypothetical protein
MNKNKRRRGNQDIFIIINIKDFGFKSTAYALIIINLPISNS